MCGGTDPSLRVMVIWVGLSPRVRGNRPLAIVIGAGHRSIPACAGEPVSHGVCNPVLPVYPRVCGGTVVETRSSPVFQGLSPRVRGNLEA